MKKAQAGFDFWRAEFKDRTVEHKFRVAALPVDQGQAARNLILIAIAYATFIVFEWPHLPSGPHREIVLAGRLGVFLAGIAVAVAIRMTRTPALMDWAALVFAALFCISADAIFYAQAVIENRPPRLLMLMVSFVLASVTVYLIAPIRFRFQLMASALIALAFFGLVAWGGVQSDVGMGIVVLFFIIANVIGVAMAHRLHELRRLHWWTLVEERSLRTQLESEIEKRRELESDLRHQASTDSLTGIMNRRRFSEVAAEEMLRAARYKHPLSLLVFDLDHFKKINDTYGHAVGDSVLKRVVSLSIPVLRGADIIARYGGEEFTVLLPETGMDGAVKMAERLRKAIEEARFDVGAGSARVTISVGVAQMGGDDFDVDTILEKADKALYTAKSDGRNLVRQG
ncbi:MAG: GGDEF domain-containing protein [Rhodospirillales bacterium]|nr:GGDEF domain-containing protein [Rhodospirillales bacterium]